MPHFGPIDREAMTLPSREERLLRRVDQALRRSDPDLASLLSIFARLNAAEAMPARERLRPQPSWAWRGLLWSVAAVAFLVAALAFLVVFAAGGGVAAALACSATPVPRGRGLRGAPGPPPGGSAGCGRRWRRRRSWPGRMNASADGAAVATVRSGEGFKSFSLERTRGFTVSVPARPNSGGAEYSPPFSVVFSWDREMSR